MVTRRLERLASASPAEALQGLMSDGYIRTGRDIGRSLSLEHAASERLLADAVESGTVVAAGDNYVAADSWIELRRQASEILAAFHQEHPLRRGVSRDSLRRSLRVPAQSWPQVLNLLIAAGTVQIDGSSLTGAGWIDGLDQRGSEMQRILKCLQQNPYDPPTEAELLRTCATDLDVLSAMVRQGRVVRVAPGMYFDREAYDRMVCAVLVGIEREGAVTVAMLRDSFATSRKYVLAFLEHLDAERITRRVGDARVRGSRGSPCVSD